MLICAAVALIVNFSKVTFDQKVTLDIPGWTVKKALETLSAKTGLKFVATDNTGNDIVIVHVKDVPIKDLMTHLADVEYGEWFKNKSEYDLQTDPKKYQAWVESCRATMAKEVTESIEKLTKRNLPVFNAEALAVQLKEDISHPKNRFGPPGQAIDHSQAVMNALQTDSDAFPISRALLQVISKLPIDKLSALAPAQRIVFSNHPTRLQYSLPESCNPIFEQLQKDQDAFIATSASLNLNDSGIPFSILPPPVDPIDTTGTFNVSIVNDFGLDLDAIAYSFDSHGMETGSTNIRLGFDPNNFTSKPISNSEAIAVPEKAAQFSRAVFAGMYGNVAPTQLTPEFLSMILHPEVYDPDSIIAEPCMVALSESKSLNVISNAGFLGMILSNPSIKTFSLASLEEQPAKSVLKMQASNGWVEISDSSPLIKSVFSLDAVSFGELLRNGIENKVVNPIAFAKYAALNSSESYNSPYLGAYLDALCGNKNNPFLNLQKPDWLLLQLIGSLDPNQISAGKTQLGLFTNQLTEKQLEYISQIVFSSFNSASNRTFTIVNGKFPSNGILDEPTYGFVNGIPPTTKIHISEPNEESLSIPYVGVNAAPGMVSSMPPQNFAYVLKSGSSNYNLTSILYSQIRYLNISIEFPGNLASYDVQKQWKENETDVKVKDWHDLPPKFVKVIQDALNKNPQ